ncbi:hypothetical protein [Anaeromyxobacter soli]|uniref:hypothetical protein n=1 Tax=Anaeromyxobacter soli TaxID=2922725 RepID=UPI001FAE95CE|nr:hypothetical protein [Anaeromyxobacter sp. SG29]
MQRILGILRARLGGAPVLPFAPLQLALLLGGTGLASACGGGQGATPGGGGSDGTITGLVVKGRVENATVTAYRLDSTMTRGAALAFGPSAQNGTFTLRIPPYNGPIEVVASGGTYLEEAVGVTVQVTRELSAVLPAFQSGGSATVTLSPISTIANSFAHGEATRGSSITDAVNNAWTHVNNHFGGLDWRIVTPTDLTPNEPVTVTMSDATKAGLVLAGMSQAARVLAEASGLSPGTSVTGATLGGAAGDDGRDGTFDGVGPGGALVQGSVGLTGQTFRRTLGQAILQFVQSSRNKTQLTGADALALASAIAANSDPYLFCPNQIASASCAGGPLELTPPVIAFVDPPSFVGSNTIDLRVTANQPVAGVSAVYAQTAAGSGPIAATLTDGVWTIAGIPLVEGPNLISVWGVDGAGGGTIANAATVTITCDTVAPTPYVQTSTAAYYDERAMTLADATVPAKYQFPPAAAKVAPIPQGAVYKSTARLSWATAPTASVLETTNPDNTPFVQLAVPIGTTQAPIAAAMYSISVGGNVYAGDLAPWLSPASTTTTAYYDLPLAGNLAPVLGTTPGPVILEIATTFVDAAGNSGTVGPISVPFTVIAPPLVIEEDTSFPSYADAKSTYPYKLANNTYAQLFDASGGSFYGGQVRLVRFIVRNPNSVPVGLRSASVGSWTATETWDGTRTRLTPRNPVTINNCVCFWSCSFTPLVLTMDGFTFSDCYQNVGNTCAPKPESQGTPPTPENVTGWFTHVAGDTAVHTACKPKRWYAGAQVVANSTVAAQGFVGPAPAAGEVTPAPAIGDFALVPAATGSTPGGIAVYLMRPLTAARTVPLGVWNQFTAGNRYEANKGYVFIPDSYTVTSSYVWWYNGSGTNGWVSEAAAHQEIGYVTGASESVNATVAFTTQGVHGSALVGETVAAYSATIDRSLTSH